ncbi:hypothetical protein [uncultured Devosia sp.]|uniref:hypothetical protein n=1 Tax=uncultured Devosia sp. TaxID=211434 RepID=UPI0026086937|nr:hypothetical protein [uncultured Devosia sp.]
MASKRETNIAGLYAALAAVPGYALKRNLPLDDLDEGFQTLQDGPASELTDEFFNGPVFEFTARPVLVIVVRHADEAQRDSLLDAAIEAFRAAAEAALPFGANVTAIRVLPPETAPREIWGALPLKGAEMTIEIDYWAETSAG